MYLLDTNILSELVRSRPNTNVVSRFQTIATGLLFTSVICIEEIRFGAKIASPGNRFWERMDALVFPRLRILNLDRTIAEIAGDLRAQWKTNGTPIGYGDGLIAATARAYELKLVTRNVRHFDSLSGVQVENWFEHSQP